jgi:hypothetical protein
MKLHRLKGAIVIAVVGMGLMAIPTAPAFAASSASGKGSNPNGPFCKLERASRSVANSANEKAATKALIAGNWKVAQKNLLAAENQSGKLVNEYSSALSSAPANVKSAAQESLKVVPALLKVLKNSTSIAQFEKAEQAVSSGAKFQHAASVIEAYDIAQCGTS